MITRILIRCALVLSLGLLTACSSFDRHWKDADQHKHGVTRWDGTWTSAKHHTSGGKAEGNRLRCLEPATGEKLTAYFHANWKVFSNDFTMTLTPVAGESHHDKARRYKGTHELPAMFGGVYHYDGLIEGDRFTANYSSSYDNGIFNLHRVKPTMEHFQLNPQH